MPIHTELRLRVCPRCLGTKYPGHWRTCQEPGLFGRFVQWRKRRKQSLHVCAETDPESVLPFSFYSGPVGPMDDVLRASERLRYGRMMSPSLMTEEERQELRGSSGETPDA